MFLKISVSRSFDATKPENLDTPFSYFYDLRQILAQAVNLLSVTAKMRRLSATKCMQHTAFRSSALRPLRSEVESARELYRQICRLEAAFAIKFRFEVVFYLRAFLSI